MPVDRDATLKQAEKLLRQGRLDGAIAEYVRLVEDQPRDWNSINALGDLYVRAGKPDKAVEQFAAIADYLIGEGFLPRAAALYKKVLKIRGDNEHSLLQLADIAIRQGLLVDAKTYLRQVGEQRKVRGDARGAMEIVIRLGTVDPDDADAKVAAARAARQMDDTATAAALLKEAAEVYHKEKRPDDAQRVLLEALEIDPSASDDPRLLFLVAKKDIEAGRLEQGRSTLTRLLSTSPEHREDTIALGCELAQRGNIEAAFLCVDLVADLALLELDVQVAADALRAFTDLVPDHEPALMKLVEVCVDGNFDELLSTTQARLADTYLATGRTTEARVIAEDLVARHPTDAENIERFRRALAQGGEPDPDGVIAERLGGEHPFVTSDGEVDIAPTLPDLPVDLPVDFPPDTPPDVPPVAAVPSPEALPVPEEPPPGHGVDEEIVTIESIEIDLNDALADLTRHMVAPTQTFAAPAEAPVPQPPPDLESVFADIRARVASEDDAAAQYRSGMERLLAGDKEGAIAALEQAAKVPIMRFHAASALGRLFIEANDLTGGVEWLERAAEAPAPTPDEGHALMFELADALERLGEGARALAILLELGADVPGYRDVHERVDRLSRVHTGE